MIAESGRCRYCRCTEDNPCSTPPSGEPCAWFNAERTVCTNDKCVGRYHVEEERGIVDAINRDQATRRSNAEQRRQSRDRRRASRRKKKAA